MKKDSKLIKFKKLKSKIPVEDQYKPCNKNIGIKDKSAWTERRLQKLQKKLFTLFKTCKIKTKSFTPFSHYCPKCKYINYGEDIKNVKEYSKLLCPKCGSHIIPLKECHLCEDKVCYKIVHEMEKYLIPYGLSIYKRSFKWRSTLEEMDRVVPESVNSLLVDIWNKKKFIHSSFGKMLRWKIIYFLDGKINLFDSDRVCSLDQIQDSFENSGESNGKDIIEYYSNSFKDAIVNFDNLSDFYGKDAIDSILDILEASVDTYNKYISPKERYSIFIRSLFAFNRFIKGKNNYLIFKNKPKSKIYYEKLVDLLKSYLSKLGDSK